MKKYENISLWRALSCMGVLLFHIFLQIDKNIFSFGRYGVLFFFIITGFLAFSSDDIYENTWGYWKKRIRRIMPMYGLILLIWLILFSLEQRSMQKGWEMLTADFVAGTWTIWVTIVFYVAAPLLVRIIRSYAGAVILLVISCIPRYIFILYRTECLDKTMQYMCFCVGGGVMYYAYKEEKENLTIFLLSLAIILFKLSGVTDDYFFYFLVFMIIFLASRSFQVKGKICRMFINKTDRYSYHIYLVHPIVLYFIKGFTWYVQIVLGLFGSLVLGWLSCQCIDEGIMRKKIVRRERV